MKTLCGRLEKFFLLFLFLNPFLDILGGLYIKLSQSYSLPGVSPSLLARMLVLAVMALYLLLRRDWKAILTVVPVGAVFVLSVLIEVKDFYAISLSEDLQYVIRFCFNLAALLCYRRVFLDSGRSREELLNVFDKAIRFSATALSLTIVLTYIVGYGFFTYGDRFGFRGWRGLFYSGNDITAVLMMILPLCFVSLYQLAPLASSSWRAFLTHLLPPAFTVAALLLIGTKTAFLSLGAVVAIALCWALWRLIRNKSRTELLRFACVIACTLLTLLVLKVSARSDVSKTITQSFEHTGAVADSIGTANTILSGRQIKLKNALRMWKEALPFSALVGVGRGTQRVVVEMDLFEIFFYYGILGFACMLWLYLREGVRMLQGVFRKFDLTGLMLLVGLGLCVGYLLIAGHVLFSVTSGFWFALLLAYAALYYGTPKKTK